MKINLYDEFQDFIMSVKVSEEPKIGDYIRKGHLFFEVKKIIRSKKGNEFIIEHKGRPLKPKTS